MACISNKESTFGRYPKGPTGGAGKCGTPYGFWQVAQCHIGKSRGGYSCPSVSIATLRDNPDISARCSLYVYMDRALSGRSGLGPWEATCTAKERDAKLENGHFVFPSKCEDFEKICKESMITSFLPDGKAKIEVSANCPATKIEFWLLSSGNPKEDVTTTKISLLSQSGEKKQAIIDLKKTSSNRPLGDFDLIRIAFKKNNTLYYQTNPSIPLH